jgi:hypothetical protein
MKNANAAKRYLKYIPSSCTAPNNQSNSAIQSSGLRRVKRSRKQEAHNGARAPKESVSFFFRVSEGYKEKVLLMHVWQKYVSCKQDCQGLGSIGDLRTTMP